MGDGCGAQPRSTSSTARDVTVAAGRDSYDAPAAVAYHCVGGSPSPRGALVTRSMIRGTVRGGPARGLNPVPWTESAHILILSYCRYQRERRRVHVLAGFWRSSQRRRRGVPMPWKAVAGHFVVAQLDGKVRQVLALAWNSGTGAVRVDWPLQTPANSSHRYSRIGEHRHRQVPL